MESVPPTFHGYVSPFFKRSPPRQGDIDSSATSSVEQIFRTQLPSVTVDARVQDQNSLIVTGESGLGYVTASPVYHETPRLTSDVERLEVNRAREENSQGRFQDLAAGRVESTYSSGTGVMESDEFQDFTTALKNMRNSNTRHPVPRSSGDAGGRN